MRLFLLSASLDLTRKGEREGKMSNDLKQAFISDMHFPKEDPRAMALFFKVMKWWQPDAFDIAGDADDAECAGRWVEGTPAEYDSVKPGADLVKKFLEEFNTTCKKAEDKHFHGGNHDYYRYKNYLKKHAPNVMDYITPESLYGLSNSGFAWHDYEMPPVKRLGGLFVHHGEAISKHSGESVRNDIGNYGVSLLRGHSHRMGSYYNTMPLAEIELEGYEIGHMTRPELHTYQTVHNWQRGFATAHISDNQAHVNLIRIKDTSNGLTCWVDGKRFDG